MVNEKETKRKLQECAMKEFSEKGYMKASLRNICREAGVTTGALYFFFEDKEDLFASLVDEPIRQLQLALQDHFSAEMEVTKKVFHGADIDNNVLLNQEITVDKLVEGLELDDDMQIARMIVNFLFTYRDAFSLLLTKAQGSRYENYFDNIVEMVEAHYMKMYMVMKGYKSKREVTKEDKFIVHWMSHDQIEIFVHVFTHCENMKEAEKQMKRLLAYIVGGWFAVIKTK